MGDETTEETTETDDTQTVTDDEISGDAEIEDSAPSKEDVTDTTDDPPKKGGVEKKIGKLTKEKSEALREAAYWRGVAEGKKTEEVSPDPVKKVGNVLDSTDYDTYEDYLDARDAKTAERVKAEILAEILSEQQKKEKVHTVQTIQTQYDKARKVYEDFDEVALAPNLPINQMVLDVALGDNFADILYALGKKPKKAAQISVMTPIQAAREIGKIEERILNPKRPTKNTITNAPEPIRPLGGGGNTDATPIEKMTFKQKQAKWEKERLEELGVK